MPAPHRAGPHTGPQDAASRLAGVPCWHRGPSQAIVLPGSHLTVDLCREYSEGKHEARRAEQAMREAVARDQTYARKVYYALNRWHVSWQLMDSFQHWVAAMRLRRVGCSLNLVPEAYPQALAAWMR